MTPRKLERLLLLEQSGELTPRQRRRLDAELAASEPARRLRDELRGLAASIPPLSASPSADAARLIATRLARPAPDFAILPPAWKPALATAAALALLFGARAYRTALAPHAPPAPVAALSVPATPPETEWSDPLGDDFAELETLLQNTSDDPFGFMEL